ncbi:MAG: DUF899 domain-containing protein [Thermomicrobiales bacterium]|nr:DUF899 domain-containing protein [Thermomicrobiales bacterium]
MTAQPPIVDTTTWETALAEQLQLEDELIAQTKTVAAARRRLPMTPLARDYTFVGPDGEQSMADVFGDARQLVVYHVMYAPEWEKACPHCTQYAINQGHGINLETSERDTRYILVSRASYEKIAAWAKAHGIQTPWYSVSTEFAEEMGKIAPGFGDMPGLSVFFKADNGIIYRTYTTSGSMVESTMPASAILRLTPYGMQEHGEDSPEGCPQRFSAM